MLNLLDDRNASIVNMVEQILDLVMVRHPYASTLAPREEPEGGKERRRGC